jgi:hypothetical protein
MLPICDHNSPFVHHAKIYIKAFILTVKFEPYIPNIFSPNLNVAKYVAALETNQSISTEVKLK